MIPTTIVDNFLQEPDSLIHYAKTLDYSPDKINSWPGVRSEDLKHINPTLHLTLIEKVMTLFLPFTEIDNIEHDVITQFQIIPQDYGSGVIHYDPSIFTAILYLNKETDVNYGTSLWTPKTNQFIFDDDYYNSVQFKIDTFDRITKTGVPITNEEEQFLKKHNNRFKKHIDIHGKFNRLCAFEGTYWHKSNDTNLKNDDRMILIMFFKQLRCGIMPLQRSKTIKLL
tara:strand:- start:5958 stop:6635 length:678 start_codon:yes stop_codon:yes gene_type:complete